ncbi:MAG: hypothetical protein HOP11_14865 [Saprospiraceae bacterium]|nr:hypothetical protein [Saprospiraceae bacterium]
MLNFIAFPENSRIWIYSSDRIISDDKIPYVHNTIQEFTNSWTSHQQGLVAGGGILHNFFIVLVVNEELNTPGGCSIDKSVHFIQDLGKKLQVDFFNRMMVHYIQNEEVHVIHLEKISEVLKAGVMNENTLFFNSLVSNKKDFINQWLTPLKDSWINKFLE